MKITSPVNHSPCSGLPLEANEAGDVYKLLALDVGLVNHAQGIKWATFKNFGENEILVEGLIAEQFVGPNFFI